MQDPQGRELLLEAGAWESGGRLKIPENLINDALARAPSRIPMHDRLGNLTMPLELGKVFFGTGSDTIFTLDLHTGARRQALAQDVQDIARLGDALENIDFVMTWACLPMHPPPTFFCTALSACCAARPSPMCTLHATAATCRIFTALRLLPLAASKPYVKSPSCCSTPSRSPPCSSPKNRCKS